MWHIDTVKTPGNERVTLLGGVGDDPVYHMVGDQLGPETSRYLLYVEGIGALVFRCMGHIEGGPHHWAIQVNGTDYWWYDGEGHCKISVDSDGSFSMSGQSNEVTGTVIPDENVQYTGRDANSLAVTFPTSDHVGNQIEWFSLPNPSIPWIDPLDNGDKIKLRTASQRYLAVDREGQISDDATTQNNGAVFDVNQTADGDYLLIDGNFIYVHPDNGTLLVSTSKEKATAFHTVLTPLGTIRIRTDDGKFLRVASKDDGSQDTVIKMDDTSYNDPSAALDLVLKGTTTDEYEAKYGVSAMDVSATSCSKQQGNVAWQLFLGFFKLLGLTSWYQEAQAEIAQALWGVLERYPSVKGAIDTLVEQARNNWEVSAPALLTLVSLLWSSGALMKAVKLWFGKGWLMVTRIVLTIVNWLGYFFKNASGWGAAAATAESIADWSLWVVDFSAAVYDLAECESSAA